MVAAAAAAEEVPSIRQGADERVKRQRLTIKCRPGADEHMPAAWLWRGKTLIQAAMRTPARCVGGDLTLTAMNAKESKRPEVMGNAPPCRGGTSRPATETRCQKVVAAVWRPV